MKNASHKPIARYALIVCLSVALLLGQTFRLHMHLQHEETGATSDHMVDVHLTTTAHETALESPHQEEAQNHHSNEIDISLIDVIKKSQWSKLILLWLFIGFVFRLPVYRCIQRHVVFECKLSSLYYLLRPPLRAPPL